MVKLTKDKNSTITIFMVLNLKTNNFQIQRTLLQRIFLNGNLIRLKSLNETTLLNLFSITYPPLVRLTIRMLDMSEITQHNLFSQIEQVYNSEKVSIYDTFGEFQTFSKYFMTMNRILDTSFYFEDNQLDMKKAQKKIYQHMRVTSSLETFDTLTLQNDFIKNIDFLLETFHYATMGQFLSTAEMDKELMMKTGYNDLPTWFKRTEMFYLEDWITVHFEKRLLHFYYTKKEEQTYPEVPQMKIPAYNKIWNEMSRKQKNNIITKSLMIIDTLPDTCLTYDQMIYKIVNGKKEELMNNFELIFKLIHHINQDKIFNKKQLINNLKQQIIDEEQRLLDLGYDQNRFIEIATSVSFKELRNMKILFMNRLTKFIEEIRFEKIFDDIEDEQIEKKKKRKRKKKTKISEKIFTKEEVVSKDQVESELIQKDSIDISMQNQDDNKDEKKEEIKQLVFEVDEDDVFEPQYVYVKEDKVQNEYHKKSNNETSKSQNVVKKTKTKKRKKKSTIDNSKDLTLPTNINSVMMWKDDDEMDQQIGKNYKTVKHSSKVIDIDQHTFQDIQQKNFKYKNVQQSEYFEIHPQSNQQRTRYINNQKRENTVQRIFVKYLNPRICAFLLQLNQKQISLKNAQINIIERIQDIIKHSPLNLSYKFEQYGSYKTSLMTPFSDIDLTILLKEEIDQNSKISIMKQISQQLKECEFLLEINPILTASVPVIKMIADPSIQYKDFQTFNKAKMRLDLIIEQEDYSTSIRTTRIVMELQDNYVSFNKVFTFLKYILGYHKLNKSYTGGLNSYGLALLYVAFLEHKKYQIMKDYTRLIFEFINFIFNEFNPEKQYIDLGYQMCSRSFPIRMKSNVNHFQSLLFIQDPTTTQIQNVTPNNQKYFEILQYFQRILLWESGIKNIISNITFEGCWKKEVLMEKFSTLLQQKYTKNEIKSIFTIETNFDKLDN